MTSPQDRPQEQEPLAPGPASDPGQGGYGPSRGGYDPYGGAPGGAATPPGAGYGAAYGGATAYGAPAGYPPPSAYGQSPPTASPFNRPGGPQLASWGSRVGAALVDAGIMIGIIVAAVAVGAALSVVSDVLGGLVMLIGYVGAIGWYVWQLVLQGRTGQTIGKRLVGIRLLGELDGRPIGAGLSIARYFVHVIDQLPCYVGYLWPLWDDKNQTFTDKVLKTVVVRA